MLVEWSRSGRWNRGLSWGCKSEVSGIPLAEAAVGAWTSILRVDTGVSEGSGFSGVEGHWRGAVPVIVCAEKGGNISGVLILIEFQIVLAGPARRPGSQTVELSGGGESDVM